MHATMLSGLIYDSLKLSEVYIASELKILPSAIKRILFSVSTNYYIYIFTEATKMSEDLKAELHVSTGIYTLAQGYFAGGNRRGGIPSKNL